MRKGLCLPLVLILFSLAAPDRDTLALKALRYSDRCFAEWGEIDGNPYEESFEGMEFEVLEGNTVVDTLWVVKSWADPAPFAWPDIGDVLVVSRFDYRQCVIPMGGYTIWYSDLKRIIP